MLKENKEEPMGAHIPPEFMKSAVFMEFPFGIS